MARFKVLKGVAHNVGASFTSLMAFAGDDYSMGHILRFARQSKMSTLTLDLLTGEGSPQQLLEEPIRDLPRWYSKMFLRLVESSGSDRALVQSATLTLTYDLRRTKSGPIVNEPQSPFTCDVSILDIRGKTYAAHFDGWWYVERVTANVPARRSWNPFTWLRSR